MPKQDHACRLLIDPAALGPWNMAVDESLLLDAADRGTATLRFYTWSEPTLSLGYFQRLADRHTHAASLSCAIVRRQTGGGAILHDRELTYSLALPAGHPLARRPDELYSAVHGAFIAVLQPPDTASNGRWKLRRHGQASELPQAREPFLCFQRRARGDVVAVPSKNAATGAPEIDGLQQGGQRERHQEDVKILGSAQRRHRGAILQHGSLLLEKSPVAPELTGWRDLTGGCLTVSSVVDALSVQLAAILDAEFFRFDLSRVPESKARELANTKYGAAVWTNRR